MLKYLELRPDQLMIRYGFIVGAGLALCALAGLIFALRVERAPRPLLFVLWTALLVGAVMFLPAAPRLATAVWRFVAEPAPPPPSGPLPVGQARLAAPVPPGASPIMLRLWYPASPGTQAPSLSGGCEALKQLALADPSPLRRFNLLLYAPGFKHAGDDSASTLVAVASHGYLVAAIDDPDLGQPDDPAAPFFDFSSQQGFEATLRRAADRSLREARIALAALDWMTACAQGDLAARVEFDHVGFLGFSFGGSVAANAAILDARVVAVANLDGWVFGRALEGGVEKPYLALMEDEPLPTERRLSSPDPATRYYAQLQQKFIDEHVRLFTLPDKYGFWFRNTVHASFTDEIFSRHAGLRSWWFSDPAETQTAIVDYLVAFFDAYLRHAPKDLLLRTESPYRAVTPLQGKSQWPDGRGLAPALAWIGLK